MLAAGGGTRLRPLTLERPKALCPVGGRSLLDHALDALVPLTSARAVNAHHGGRAVVGHVVRRHGDDVHVALEDVLLGTGGALGGLRSWIDGRPVVVVNADALHQADLSALVRDWDGERIRFLLAGPTGTAFAPGVRLCGVLMPWAAVAPLRPEPSSVYDRVWRPWADDGRVEVLAGYDGPWFDCGTPHDYLAANLAVSGGDSVVGSGARVDGDIERSVVWDGAEVGSGERLVDAIRTTAGRTVLVRWRDVPAATTTAQPWATS